MRYKSSSIVKQIYSQRQLKSKTKNFWNNLLDVWPKNRTICHWLVLTYIKILISSLALCSLNPALLNLSIISVSLLSCCRSAYKSAPNLDLKNESLSSTRLGLTVYRTIWAEAGLSINDADFCFYLIAVILICKLVSWTYGLKSASLNVATLSGVDRCSP